MSLTEEQERLFNSIESPLRKEVALEFIKNGYENGTVCYLRACENLKRAASKNPDTSASEILGYPRVIEFINSVKIEAARTVQIDAGWVLEQAKNSFLINANTFKAEHGADEMVSASSAAKFLEMCGKHVSVKAFEKSKEEEGEAQPLSITFEVADAKAEVQVTNAKP